MTLEKLAQMVQRVLADRRVDAAQEIQIKKVFPGLAAQRPGFDLDHIQIPHREGAQGAE